MSKWVLKCEECGLDWILEVSFDLSGLGKIYHYCRGCRKNTFHKVVDRRQD